MLTQQFEESLEFDISATIDQMNFPLQWTTFMFEIVILRIQTKGRIFKMLQNQFLIYIIKASFVPNSKPLSHLAQFLHLSVVLERLES